MGSHSEGTALVAAPTRLFAMDFKILAVLLLAFAAAEASVITDIQGYGQLIDTFQIE